MQRPSKRAARNGVLKISIFFCRKPEKFAAFFVLWPWPLFSNIIKTNNLAP